MPVVRRAFGHAASTIAVLTAALLAALVCAAPAAAAGKPLPGTIGSIVVKDGTVTGVVTVRGGSAGGATAMTATVGGKAAPVTVKPMGQQRRATILVVDTSGSMGEAGMATVRQAAAAFLRDAPKDVLVGLVSFAGTAGVDVPLTADRGRVQKAINALRSRGETSLYDGVAAAVTALGTTGDRSIILLSDGGDTASVRTTKHSATESLRAAGVRAEVIAFKTDESDNTALKGFATAGGGSVAAAGDTGAVQAAFEAAAKVLDSQVTFSLTAPENIRSKQPVALAGTASGTPFTAQTVVDFGAAPVPVPSTTSTPTATATIAPDDQQAVPIAPAPAKEGLRTNLLLGLAATFVGLMVLFVTIVAPMLRSDRTKRVATIESYLAGGASVVTEKAHTVTPSAISTNLIHIGDKVMEGRESTGKTMALIERADLPLRAGEWWILRIVSVVVATAISMVFFRGGLIATLVGAAIGIIVGVFLPALVLKFLAHRRSKKFEKQLPDVLTLVASSLSTGFSLLQALDAVAKDAAEPSAKEFARALAETRIGSDVGDALERTAGRMDSENLRWTSMAIRIQREVGGNLAETLRTTAKTLREREELRGQVRALSAEGRLSAGVLIALPIGLFLYMYKVNHSYLELLWTRGTGIAMLAVGTVFMFVGILWMRKVVDVEV